MRREFPELPPSGLACTPKLAPGRRSEGAAPGSSAVPKSRRSDASMRIIGANTASAACAPHRAATALRRGAHRQPARRQPCNRRPADRPVSPTRPGVQPTVLVRAASHAGRSGLGALRQGAGSAAGRCPQTATSMGSPQRGDRASRIPSSPKAAFVGSLPPACADSVRNGRLIPWPPRSPACQAHPLTPSRDACATPSTSKRTCGTTCCTRS